MTAEAGTAKAGTAKAGTAKAGTAKAGTAKAGTANAALYPGTFDPITKGHIDIIRRAAALFQPLWVSVAENHEKNPIFSLAERKMMLEEEIASLELDIRITAFSGLLIDFAREKKISFIVRGLRVLSDFEYELQMAGMNQIMDKNIETVFFMANDRTDFISSRLIKEISKMGGDVSPFVTEKIKQNLDNYWKKLHDER